MRVAYSFALAGLAWVAVGTLAEARRGALREDSPALRTGIEADLAGRRCPGIRIDADRFRQFARAHGMSHADFFMTRPSTRLKRELAMTNRQLRAEPNQTCARLWSDYGAAGGKVVLLTRTVGE
jgi:hypothetical protein